MIGYTTLSRSMNGIKTLSDGISLISDGIAEHENVIYADFIKSEDNKTILINDKITTETIDCIDLECDNINATDINSDDINCKMLNIVDVSGNMVYSGDGLLKKFTFNGESEFNDDLRIINTIMHQTQGGYIMQTGTNFNTLKDSKINGFLEIGSNIVQTGGSSLLKDLTVDNINMNTNKGITQNGAGINNTLGTTTITNLTITGNVTFPSSVTIPGTTTSDDIIMNGSSVITQDTTATTSKFNKLRYTKTLDLDIDGNLTQIKAGGIATLKNTIIEGTSTLQGDIEQTAGFTKLNTIECNNITLRTDNDINLSGTGKINQIGNGINAMNAIVLNPNQNITFNGSGIISQALNGTNIFSHFRGTGFGIISGRNNATFGHYQNIQNNNGYQMQYNRDNSSFYSYFMNNRSGSGGGFRFQRYSGGVYVDEPLVIDDNITFNSNVNIVGKNLTCSNATLGIISQAELDCLDNCNINIITKFGLIDDEIDDLQNTAGGISTATTGITYESSNDTTTIDNNLVISANRALFLGQTNVNSFITDTNTFITASSNTLQGIVYDGVSDTTTINNNVNITNALIVQGMNIKEEIDALETSFTTGTLTSTNITATNLNVTNQLNLVNSIKAYRNINFIGYLNFCDTLAGTEINSLSIGTFNNIVGFDNKTNFGHYQFSGKNLNGNDNGNKLYILPDASIGNYNPITQNNDVLLFGSGNSIGDKNLSLTVWSNTSTGVRIEPTKTTVIGGNNKVTVDDDEINITGNKVIINNYDFDEEAVKLTNVQYGSDNYSLSPSSSTSGNNNILACIAIVQSRFKKNIRILVPMSLTRSFRVNQDFIQWVSITESFKVNINVYKNDVFHSTFSTLNTLTNTISIFTDQPSSFVYTYNYFCGSIAFEFIPDYNPDSVDVYKFYFTYTNNYNPVTDTLLGFVPAGFEMTTNTTFTTFTTNGNVRTTPILDPYIPLEHYTQYIRTSSSTNFTQVNQPLVSPEIITNSINTVDILSNAVYSSNMTTNNIESSNVTTENINTSTLSATSINSNCIPGAYCFNSGFDQYSMPIPVLFSTRNLNGALFKTINWGIIYPNYRMRFYINTINYDNDDFNSFVFQTENLTNNPITFNLPSPIFDNSTSWRLYRYINSAWTEVRIAGLS